MTRALFVFSATVVLLCLGGCVSDTIKLKLGLTKEEVVQVMGQPQTVSADGTYEYLNYLLPETSGGTFGTVTSSASYRTGTISTNSFRTRQYTVRLLDGRVEAFGYPEQIGRRFITAANPTKPAGSATGALVAAAPGPGAAVTRPAKHLLAHFKSLSETSGATADQVEIVSIERAPTTPAAQSWRLTARIKYSVFTRDSARLEFATQNPRNDGYIIQGVQNVAKGSGEVECSIVYGGNLWDEPGWNVGAFIRPEPEAKPLARDLKVCP